MENYQSSSLNIPNATKNSSSLVTPVKVMKSTRPVAMSVSKTDTNRLWSADSSSRPATARKGEITTPRTPFSPLNDSVVSTTSDSREAARQAKLKAENDRINKVAQLKAKWANEKERKVYFHNHRRALELKKLQDDTQAAAELRKRNLEKQREIATKQKDTQKEQLSSSLKARKLLAEDLEAQAKAKRRISVFLNSTMRKRAMAKATELDLQKKEHEKDLLNSRRTDCLFIRQAKKLEEDRRRESLSQHAVIAMEQKKHDNELLQKQLEEDRLLFEMRHLNWEDDKASKEEAEQERRVSLAHRLDQWRAEKSQIQAAKEQILLAEEMDYELQQQARNDMKTYQEYCAANRRQSLSYRLDKAKKDRDYEHGQKALLAIVQDEERRLDELDRAAINEYKEKILEARRLSLQYRSNAFQQSKMQENGEKQMEKLRELQEYELRNEGWKDVQEYRAKQREASRRSLAWRLADSHRKQEVELNLHEEHLRKLHLDLLCKREDAFSKREAQEEDNERRRRSIALRLQSWREVRMNEEKQKEKLEMQKEEDALLREMDREDLLAAKLTFDHLERRKVLGSSMLL
jgi:hypothetical protein